MLNAIGGGSLNAQDTTSEPKNSNEITIGGRSDRLFKLLVLLAVITLVAAGVLTVAYLLSVRTSYFSELVISGRLVIGVIGVCLLASLEFTLLARRRIVRNKSYGIANGCPACGEHRLIRIHRHRNDRLLATIFRLPLRRYVCQICQWTGVMVFSPAMINPDIAKALSLVNANAGMPRSDSAQTMGVNHQTVDDALTISSNGVDSIGENVIYATKAVVNAPFGLSLRSAPHNSADILSTLQSETVVTLVDPFDEDLPATWRKVVVGNQVGWVSAAFLSYLG